MPRGKPGESQRRRPHESHLEDRHDVAYALSGSSDKNKVKTSSKNGWCIVVVTIGDGSYSSELLLTLPRSG